MYIKDWPFFETLHFAFHRLDILPNFNILTMPCMAHVSNIIVIPLYNSQYGDWTIPRSFFDQLPVNLENITVHGLLRQVAINPKHVPEFNFAERLHNLKEINLLCHPNTPTSARIFKSMSLIPTLHSLSLIMKWNDITKTVWKRFLSPTSSIRRLHIVEISDKPVGFCFKFPDWYDSLLTDLTLTTDIQWTYEEKDACLPRIWPRYLKNLTLRVLEFNSNWLSNLPEELESLVVQWRYSGDLKANANWNIADASMLPRTLKKLKINILHRTPSTSCRIFQNLPKDLEYLALGSIFVSSSEKDTLEQSKLSLVLPRFKFYNENLDLYLAASLCHIISPIVPLPHKLKYLKLAVGISLSDVNLLPKTLETLKMSGLTRRRRPILASSTELYIPTVWPPHLRKMEIWCRVSMLENLPATLTQLKYSCKDDEVSGHVAISECCRFQSLRHLHISGNFKNSGFLLRHQRGMIKLCQKLEYFHFYSYQSDPALCFQLDEITPYLPSNLMTMFVDITSAVTGSSFIHLPQSLTTLSIDGMRHGHFYGSNHMSDLPRFLTFANLPSCRISKRHLADLPPYLSDLNLQWNPRCRRSHWLRFINNGHQYDKQAMNSKIKGDLYGDKKKDNLS
jgi:hypothetical protein